MWRVGPSTMAALFSACARLLPAQPGVTIRQGTARRLIDGVYPTAARAVCNHERGFSRFKTINWYNKCAWHIPQGMTRQEMLAFSCRDYCIMCRLLLGQHDHGLKGCVLHMLAYERASHMVSLALCVITCKA